MKLYYCNETNCICSWMSVLGKHYEILDIDIFSMWFYVLGIKRVPLLYDKVVTKSYQSCNFLQKWKAWIFVLHCFVLFYFSGVVNGCSLLHSMAKPNATLTKKKEIKIYICRFQIFAACIRFDIVIWNENDRIRYSHQMLLWCVDDLLIEIFECDVVTEYEVRYRRSLWHHVCLNAWYWIKVFMLLYARALHAFQLIHDEDLAVLQRAV